MERLSRYNEQLEPADIAYQTRSRANRLLKIDGGSVVDVIRCG
jgi:hypothetical protein